MSLEQEQCDAILWSIQAVERALEGIYSVQQTWGKSEYVLALQQHGRDLEEYRDVLRTMLD